MNTVEATCRGDPGAVYLSSTIRQAVFANSRKKTLLQRHQFLKVFTLLRKKSVDIFTEFFGRIVKEPTFWKFPQSRFTRQCNVTGGQTPLPFEKDVSRKINCVMGYLTVRMDQTNQIVVIIRLIYNKTTLNDFDYQDLIATLITTMHQMGIGGWMIGFFNVFSISKENGIGLIETPIPFSSKRPIHFYCEGPTKIHRGESVGIRCMIMNRSPYSLVTVIILKGLSSGDHHHLVWVKAEDEMEVHIPIAPQKEQGQIDVDISLSTQIMSQHTSVLLDLKSRANVYDFMNVIVDKDPIIPNEVYRRYISGSPYAHMTVCGDVIGPTFPGDMPVSLENFVFPLVMGAMGKEQKGWLSNWDHSKPNVWLTAWVIRIFKAVSYQDWEDYIYIDPTVVGSAVLWLLNYQTEEGSFSETEYYPYPLHKPMEGKSLFYGDDSSVKRNISLTAHVLISLETTAANLQGEQKKFSATARQRAMNYLEKNLRKNYRSL
ncbi:unnamed protein product [Lepeophtheirus salmonis]|uniref:(salmon louse) hypothetical protein n=1 Tax=Lepeophtheirus salmonis TaxID=72036 RepID=A0A7R8CQB2_LEPSM|nr:unnamed protein product [Lepeophtheirus salmonis]CAF2893582.1 unnamed protein product [Lepeophtheirus salmonis]